MTTRTPTLPFPSSRTIHVYRDHPEMAGLRPWQFPTDAYVTTYTLPTDEYGYVELTDGEWELFSADLTRQHPGCVFSYIEE